MGYSIYGIGLSALNAAQVGMSTTGHNISNATTAGFHRQEATQVTNIPQYTGAGFLGQGVHVDTVKRIYSEFLDTQVLQTQTSFSRFDSYNAQASQLDNLLADVNSGMSPALQDFFMAVNDVSGTPSSAPSRQTVLSGAQAMVTRIQGLATRMTEMRDGINTQVRNSVELVNSLTLRIADLNQQVAIGTTFGQPPNDLLDQREQLIAELNKEVQVSVVKQDNGSLNIFIGSGQPLVLGTKQLSLSASPSTYDPERLEVGLVVGNATAVLDSSMLQGGNLSGLLAYRSEVLDMAQNALGRVAMGLTQTFNDQQKLGQDLNGDLGENFFTALSPKPPIAKYGNAAGLTATLTVGDVSKLTTEDYNLQWSATAGAWQLTTVKSGATVAMTGSGVPGDPFIADGMSIEVTGAPNDGNGFQFQPTRNAAGEINVAITDTAKIAAATPIRTAATLAANTGTGIISAGTVNATPVTPDPAHPSTDLNLKNQVTISFTSATTFDVTDAVNGVLDAGVAYTPGANISYNGWTVQIAGAPALSDTFTIGPTINGVTDNRNALLLAGLQTKNTLANGTATFQGTYSQMVSVVANKTNEAQVNGKAQQTLLEQATQTQQSLSGVNLDEEAANLLRYQQAYQAAGKMIQIVGTLFDTLLNLR
ncbi:MAG: flagellar hook-associated protein FlgK [Sulfuricellaceae bacterium]